MNREGEVADGIRGTFNGLFDLCFFSFFSGLFFVFFVLYFFIFSQGNFTFLLSFSDVKHVFLVPLPLLSASSYNVLFSCRFCCHTGSLYYYLTPLSS